MAKIHDVPLSVVVSIVAVLISLLAAARTQVYLDMKRVDEEQSRQLRDLNRRVSEMRLLIEHR